MSEEDPSFGVWLKRRRKDLDLTQETLAEGTGCSSDMVRKIEAGLARPSRQLAELLVVRLGLPAEEQGRYVRWARAGPSEFPPSARTSAGASPVTAPTDQAVDDRSEIRNPYKGLRPFGENDAPDFFGREALTGKLMARISEREKLSRFLAVVGPSGSGKSSVVRAGLVPALRGEALPGGKQPVVVDLIPGTHPLEELEASLLRVAVNPPASLMPQLREDERGLARAVKRVLSADERTELVLVIDQFEELFTLTEDEAARADFLDSIFSAVTDPRSRLWVVVTLRADFYDRPLLYSSSGELLATRTEVVVPLTPGELYQAITVPAERAGLTFEADLAATIMQDIGDQPGTLPLLQYALTELYERREGHVLTMRAYAASGGVLGSLARRAESLYEGLTANEQAEVRQLFLRVVTLGEGVEDTRRRVPITEVSSAARDESALQRVLDVYGRYRMLTFDRDPITGGPTIEVAHESLLRNWARLRGWLDDSRDILRTERRLLSSAHEWQAAGQDASFLAGGVRLLQFAGLAKETDRPQALALTGEEREYLAASLKEQERQANEEEQRRVREVALQKRAATRLRMLVASLTVFLLVAVVLAGWALNRSQVAQTNEQVARTNLGQANALRWGAEANSLLLAHGDSQLIALLAIRSLQSEYSPEADAALSGAALLAYPLRRYEDPGGPSGMALSPDGKYLAIANGDKTVGIWDVATAKHIRDLSGHRDVVLRAHFSPDGKYLASASFDGTARLWDVATGHSVRVFSGHQNWVTEAIFSPDGKYLATSSKDGTARLWDITTGQTLRSFSGHEGEVWDVAFSPDGKYLLTASSGKTVRLWNVATGQMVRAMSGHTDLVEVVAYSPDGRYLASGGDDKTVRLWDAATGEPLGVLTGTAGDVQGLAFSPDSKYLVSGGDSAARLWDVASGRLVRLFAGHKDSVYGVAFTSNGKQIVTSSFDNTALLWPVLPAPGEIQFAGHDAGVQQATFSPDGKRVVTASEDHTARVWDAATGLELLQLLGHELRINSASFSPDGKTIITASDDKTARIWDAESGQQVMVFNGHTNQVGMAVFSPDGKYVASAGTDDTAHVWDAQTGANLLTMDEHNSANTWNSIGFAHNGSMIVMGNADSMAYIRDPFTGKDIQRLRGHEGLVRDAAFSPDDKYVLTSGDDTARLWEAQSGKELQRFAGHSGPVFGVAFSPDGKYALTGGADATARLWDLQSGKELRRFSGHAGAVYRVAFSPDGKYILTASSDKTARLWHADYHDTILYLCGQLSRDLTSEERDQYGITDQRSTCPAH